MSEFFSREELLGGLPARQASTVLFAIKSRTASLMAQSRQAATRFALPTTADVRERDFLEALAQGRDPPFRPRIQDLERYAPEWAALVPANPRVQATIVHMLVQDYTFAYQHVPRLRRALSLDTEAVTEAYQRIHRQPLHSIYALHIPRRERWRWIWAGLARRLEELSPFWIAFALTLTETVGASILALPIALAGVGPLAGVVLLLVLGLVNVLTLVAITEAVTRNGTMRYGSSFFGRLVGDYLGGPGSLLLNVTLLPVTLLILSAFYIGMATTLAQASGISSMVWAALLFVIGVYVLRRQSLDATIASALLIGALNIGLIIILSLLALPHVTLNNVLYLRLPFISGQPFTPGIFQLIFGVVLAAYFGHTAVGNMAKVVLRRDPSGRTMLRGNVAAMTTTMCLYMLWVVAINGTLAPATLVSTSGTALVPLAAAVGPSVAVFGSMFAVFSMGMGSIHMSLGLFNQVREWLPRQLTPRQASSMRWRVTHLVLSRSGRFWIGVLPVMLTFLVVEWLLWTGQESFAGTLGFLGAITVPLLGGIFPVLMLAASRRKGTYVPGVVWHLVGHPLVMGCIYALFLAGLFVHGLVLWQHPVQRGAALCFGLLLIGVTGIVIRRGAFTPRAVVELRHHQATAGHAVCNIVAKGQWLPAEICLVYRDHQQCFQAATLDISDFDALLRVSVHIPAMPVRELELRVHQLTPNGESVGLPARVELQCAGEQQTIDLAAVSGHVILPFSGAACRIEIDVGANQRVSTHLADR